MKDQALSPNNREQGFTLVELMISIIIFLIGIGLVYQVLRLGTIQRNTISTRSDSNKGSRIALNYIRRDAINAGLSYHNIGGNVPDNYTNTLINATSDADTERDLLTGIFAGNNVGNNILNLNNQMDSVGFIARDLDFNNGSFIDFVSTGTSGTAVTITTKAGGTANCNLYDLYLFETGTSQTIGMITAIDKTANKLTLGFGDPLGINQSATAAGDAKSPLVAPNAQTTISGTFKKINLITYSISASGALVRRIYGNQTGQPAASQIVSSELIYNVQDFQIRYLLDDGSVSDDPSLGNSGRGNQQLMNRVIEIEITLTIKQEDNNIQIKNPPPTVIKEIISTRNLRYTIG